MKSWLKKGLRITISIASFAPLLLFLFASLMLPIIVEPTNNNELFNELNVRIRLIAAAVLAAVMIFYIFWILRTKIESLQEKKALWITILFLGNVFAVPFFWYLHFLKHK